MKKRRFIFIAFLSAFAFSAIAQIPEEELNAYKEKYPEENSVGQFNTRKIWIDYKNDNIYITETNEEQRFIISDRANAYSKSEVGHNSFFELKEIEAYALNPSGKKYVKEKVDEFAVKDELDHSFHDDNKSTTFSYSGLQQGSKIYLKYNMELKEPAILPAFYFQDFYKTELQTFEITVSPKVKIEYRLFNLDSFNVDFQTTTDKSGYTTYSWKLKDVDEIPNEGATPGMRYFVPHIQFFISEINGKKFLGTTKELHNHYTKYLSEINLEEDQALKSLVDSLVVGKTDEMEKVRTIYQWVQNNIKYIAFEEGYGGFIPRQAKDIYQKRFGDCKDMASIIHEMLKYANIPSYWTWIGSRDIPYTYDELPTTATDNHMITTYIANDKVYFLDGTSSNTPFGMPSSFIQDKQALLHISSDSFLVKTVPIIPADQSKIADTVELHIENNLLKGEASTWYTGFHRDKVIYLFSDYDKSKRQQKFKSYHELGNNKQNITAFNEFNIENKDKPYIIEYSFEIPDYVHDIDDKMYINLNLHKPFTKSKVEEKRKLDWEFDFEQSFEKEYIFTIPEGYTVSYLPPNANFTNPLFTFTFTYTQEDNKIYLYNKITYDFLILEKKNFDVYNDFIDQLNKAYSESIVLEKN